MRWYSLNGVPRGSKNGSGASMRIRIRVCYPISPAPRVSRHHAGFQFYSLMKRPGLKTALAVLKLTVSAGLLAVLFNRADLRTMLGQFRQMNLGWMSAALGMYALMLLVSAWRWRLLLRIQSVAVGFGLLTKSFLVATFFNNFLPSNIGGDVVRVADTAPFTGSKTVATTV